MHHLTKWEPRVPPIASDSPAFWACPKCKTPNPWAGYLTQCLSCGGPRPAAAAKVLFIPEPQEAPVPPRRVKGGIGLFVSWAYLLVVLVVWVLVKMVGESWWPSSALLFGPRWMFLFPIPAVLLWISLRKRWMALVPLGLTLFLVAGPLMGLCVPVRSLFASIPRGEHVRVFSLNRGTGLLDSKRLIQLIDDERFDIVCIQEFRPDPVLDAYFSTTGWHRDRDGSIWSRFPIIEDLGALSTETFEVHGAWPLRLNRVRIRLKNGRDVVVANIHMPTMTYAFEHLLKGDLPWFRYYVGWRSREMDRLIELLQHVGDSPLIVAGDFNMPPDSAFMLRLREHYTSGFEAVGWGYGYTRPSRLSWAGIDRILGSVDCRFVQSKVGPLVGSDHRPITAELIVPPRP